MFDLMGNKVLRCSESASHSNRKVSGPSGVFDARQQLIVYGRLCSFYVSYPLLIIF